MIGTLHLSILPWIAVFHNPALAVRATIVVTLLLAIPAPARGAVQLLILEMHPYAEVVLASLRCRLRIPS